MTSQTVLAILETAFSEEAEPFDAPEQDLARHELVLRGLSGHQGILDISVKMGVDVIGLGASAPSYYPSVGKRLGCEIHLPKFGDVANAIGAVVGQISQRMSGTITVPGEGLFRVHSPDGTSDFRSQYDATAALESSLSNAVTKAARDAGAESVHVELTRDIRTVDLENRQVFVEATITAEARGRPRIAHEP